MTRPQRILTLALWCLCAVAVGALVAITVIRNSPANRLPRYFQVPEFSLTDQNGKAFTNKDLAGNVWLAEFVFTRCAGPCPAMTSRMLELQKSITDPDVHFVSVTVDPEYDTPQVLKRYAEAYGADESRWSFLTGDKAAIFSLARDGMKIPAIPADADNVIIHSEKFILVDQHGWIRGYYDLSDKDALSRLPADLKALAG